MTKRIRDRYKVLSKEELPQVLSREPTQFTSNPLRFGEPARMFGAQTHIWGEQPDPSDPKFPDFIRSKEIQNIAICFEDIEHLAALLKIMPQASDYMNKLIGKYIILEINNISSCFKSLARASQKFRNVNSSLQKQLKRLDKTHRFGDVRNKMAAHKHHRGGTSNLTMIEQTELWRAICVDSLNAYLQVIREHVAQLQPLAPFEYQQMFLVNGEELRGVLPPLCAEGYTPFYAETRNWRPAPPEADTTGSG